MSRCFFGFVLLQFTPAIFATSGTDVLRICTDDRAGLDVMTALHMRREAEALAHQLGVRTMFHDCGPGAVRVRILTANGSEPDVLGKARVRDARVVPEVHLYVRHVERRIVQVNPLLLGRALGRVLAHELGHYLLQTQTHEPDGLLAPALAEGALSADRPQKARAFTQNSQVCH